MKSQENNEVHHQVKRRAQENINPPIKTGRIYDPHESRPLARHLSPLAP